MQEIALAILRHFFLLAALLTPLEVLFPVRRTPGLWRRGTLTDLSYFVVSPFLINLGMVALLAGFAAAVGWVIPRAWQASLRTQPAALQLAEIFGLAELGGYFIHRLSHRVSWLWRFHRVHHSSSELDWLAAHRQHPVEAIWLLGVANLPLVVLGFSFDSLAWFVLLQKIYTAFLHANLRIGYGRFTIVLASPQFHHWHHDADGQSRTYNFASTLPILDWLFGTYRVPAAAQFPVRYGLAAGEQMPESYVRQLAQPFLPMP